MSEPLRVLGLAGSPRRRGNSETLLDQFLSGAQAAGAQVRKVLVPELDIAGCIACGGCSGDGVCVVEDDFQAINQELIESDVIAVAAPLFFWNVPAKLKALIDRGQSQWSRKFLVKEPLLPTRVGHERRRGVFICVGADPRAYFEGAKWTVRSFFRVYEAEYWGELFYHRIEGRGAIREHAAAMDEAVSMGERAVREPWQVGVEKQRNDKEVTMPRYGVETKLSPDEIIQKAVDFFGEDGVGLEVTERSACCASFEGGGGHVSVTVNQGPKTEVELVTREWDYDVRRFMREIS